MQNMKYYYDFSGQKFGYPLSLSINSFQRQVFSAQKSLEISYVLKGEYEVITSISLVKFMNTNLSSSPLLISIFLINLTRQRISF